MSDLNKLLAETLTNNVTGKVQENITENINNLENELNTKINKIKDKLSSKINNIENILENKPLVVNFGTIEKPKNELVHKCFSKVLKILQSQKRINKNIMLVGPAGSGKSLLCNQIAKSLNKEFYPVSVGLQTTKSDLIGYLDVHGKYVTTPIREAYEKGGILLLDELDAGNAGVLTILNGLLANEVYGFPDKKVNKHSDFICICACNTYGTGATLDYIGRNKLDSATLDRFMCVEVEYDEELEAKLINNDDLHKIIKKIRNNIKEFGLKVIVSPRASMQCADLLDADFSIEEALEMVIFKGVNEEVRQQLLKGINLTKEKKNLLLNDNFFVDIRMNFDTNEFYVGNLLYDITIKPEDWDGHYYLYLSANNSFAPSLKANAIFLNSGKNRIVYTPNSVVNFNPTNFLRDLNDNYTSIKTDIPLHISVKCCDKGYQFICGV